MVIAMTIVCLSLSRRFVPAGILEKLAVSAAELGEVLARLHAVPGVDEAAQIRAATRTAAAARTTGPAVLRLIDADHDQRRRHLAGPGRPGPCRCASGRARRLRRGCARRGQARGPAAPCRHRERPTLLPASRKPAGPASGEPGWPLAAMRPGRTPRDRRAGHGLTAEVTR